MKIALLMTGNELMAGDTVDSNSCAVSKAFAQWGFDVDYKVTIGDDFDLLCAEMDRLSDLYPLVLVNGGLGPTIDDLTSEAMAKVCGVSLKENPTAKDHVVTWCGGRSIEVSQANMKQAFLPEGSEVLHNPVGSAPGIACKKGEAWFFATPGVPSELKAMLEGSVKLKLISEFPHASGHYIRRIKLFGIGESTVQQTVVDQLPDWPAEVDLGFRAGLPLLEIKLTVASEELLGLRDQCEAKFTALFKDSIVGDDDDDLASLVIGLLQKKSARIALAESCTGGKIAAMLTSIAGASAVFDAGVVSYANAAKEHFLGVNPQTIESHGVVSEPVVIEMAQGILREARSDLAIAVSGIAGPDGGTANKPVGTVCIAWGGTEDMQSIEFCFPFGRQMFQTYVSAVALDLMRRKLSGIEELPEFLQPGGRFSKKRQTD